MNTFLGTDRPSNIAESMSNDLKDKVAFITGAAHGQGRATAIALADLLMACSKNHLY